MISDKTKVFYLACATLPPVMVTGVFVATSAQNSIFARADNTNSIVLDESNSPTLSSGEGTMVDSKGVTWEYHNASDYESGHVELNHEGYVGVSQGSAYGITGITDLTVTFEAGSTGELWLLNSLDGINWGEVQMLKTPSELEKTSETCSLLIENWRYVRLYYYDTNSDPIDIDNVTIHYSCSGVSAQEDVDGARIGNVIESGTSTNMTHAADYDDLSPYSDGGEAVRFTKTGKPKDSSTAAIGFGKTYTIGQILTAKVEFDMKTDNINYGKTIILVNNATTVTSTVTSDSTLVENSPNSYKCTLIEDKWYHIEVAVSSLITNISGYQKQDIPAKDVLTRQVNGIKTNAGSCVIDNLRITSMRGDTGNYNNTKQYPPKVNTVSWLKVSWVGVLYPNLVQISCSPANALERIPISETVNGSPFYVRWLVTGDVTVTWTVVSGYNRSSHTLSKTFTVSA